MRRNSGRRDHTLLTPPQPTGKRPERKATPERSASQPPTAHRRGTVNRPNTRATAG
jgi:hypothetical protein